MSRIEHVVIADDEGCFYCRAVDSILNYKKDQHVCGYGCPCFVKSLGGRFVCSYDDKVMDNRQSLFPSVEGFDAELQKAYEYAAKAHKGQYRKGTKVPYLTHIITTMNYALELTNDIQVLQAAILHDTVEDTKVTLDEIRKEFGDRVAELVEAETEDKRHGIPASQTWELRKRESIEHLEKRPIDVKKIVLADKTANAESLVREWIHVGDDIWKKFNQTDKKKQEWYFKTIREKLDELSNTNVMKVFDEYLDILFD